MKTLLGSIVVLAAVASPALAQVKSKMITLKSGDEEIKAFLAVPEGKGPFPSIVVIQEWWGLNDWIKENATRMAQKGYIALAPDLYRGKVTDNPKVAMTLVKGLPPDRAVGDLKAAVDYLSSFKRAKKGRIGSIGWCMGGGYSLQLALADDRVVACTMCYGRPVDDPAKLQSLKAKVLGVFGEEDKGIKASSVREFEAALKKAGRKVENIHIFSGAGHGFMRPNNGAKENPAYREVQARQAWEEIDAFFAKTLGK